MAVKLLNAVTSTGASGSWPLRMGVKEHTVQATFTGDPTAVSIILEGSLDEQTWYQLAIHNALGDDLVNQQTMFHVTSKLVNAVRINLSTLTGGSSPTVTALYEGENS